MTKRLTIVTTLVGVLVLILVAGLIRNYSKKAPLREAQKLAQPVFADAPTLSGNTIWSKAVDGGFAPATFSFEPHGGVITHNVTKVATADVATANKEYSALINYMATTKMMPDTEPILGTLTYFGPLVTNNYALSGEVFVIRDATELKHLSIMLSDKDELAAKLEQHFAQSGNPIYGYSMTGSYSY